MNKETIVKDYQDYKKTYDGIEDKNSNAALQLMGAMNALEHLCPELKESESEKIKKQIIGFITYSKILDETKKNWIAWLEKQGEQKPWGEEDERIRQDIENLIHFALEDGSAVSPAANTTKEGAISWIQSLKDRVQPKQEWSEEDESHIRYLIECLEHCKKGVALTMTTSTSQEYINWLKSLKPQNRWQPSDEQLIQLSNASNGLYYNCETLLSLLEQLKKLREE